MDGSSDEFIKILENTGIRKQKTKRKFIKILNDLNLKMVTNQYL